MNGKVATMLRKTGRDTHAAKRWWNSLGKDERGQLRSDYNKMKAVQAKSAKM